MRDRPCGRLRLRRHELHGLAVDEEAGAEREHARAAEAVLEGDDVLLDADDGAAEAVLGELDDEVALGFDLGDHAAPARLPVAGEHVARRSGRGRGRRGMSRAPVEANGLRRGRRHVGRRRRRCAPGATGRGSCAESRSIHAAPANATAPRPRTPTGCRTARATRPSAIGPRPSPRSMAALAVPDAAPRCDGVAVAKIAEKNAGVLKATPTAMTATPTISPAGAGQSATRPRPSADRRERGGRRAEATAGGRAPGRRRSGRRRRRRRR